VDDYAMAQAGETSDSHAGGQIEIDVYQLLLQQTTETFINQSEKQLSSRHHDLQRLLATTLIADHQGTCKVIQLGTLMYMSVST